VEGKQQPQSPYLLLKLMFGDSPTLWRELTRSKTNATDYLLWSLARMARHGTWL
jgi:hypothetical protein